MVGVPVQPLPGLVIVHAGDAVRAARQSGRGVGADDGGDAGAASAGDGDGRRRGVGGRRPVTLAKTTRFADGVAVSTSVRFGLAVIVTTTLEVRGVGL